MPPTWTSEDFPVGYFDLHPDRGLNFQLNRLYDFTNDPVALDILRSHGAAISCYDDLVRRFIEWGDAALSEGAALRAAHFYRGAEFFLPATDARKRELSRRFLDLALTHYEITPADHHRIPYDHAALSAYRFTPPTPRGTVVFLNGFDGYLEELMRVFLVFRDAGYDVIAFDGPGQGLVLEEFELPMTPRWEAPTAAILDYFGIEDVTLIGCSLGGYLALRAAAFESRISRVVAFDIMPDFFTCVTSSAPHTLRRMLRTIMPRRRGRALVNGAARRVARRDLTVEWGLDQGMRVMGARDPYDFLHATMAYRTAPFAARIDQDVLLLAGHDDHFVPITELPGQIATLTGARSLTTRTFTAADAAGQHCQLGNIGLAIDTMLAWLDGLVASRAAHPPPTLPDQRGRRTFGAKASQGCAEPAALSRSHSG